MFVIDQADRLLSIEYLNGSESTSNILLNASFEVMLTTQYVCN